MKPLHVAVTLSVAVHALAMSPAGVDRLLSCWRKPSAPVIDLSLIASAPVEPAAPSTPMRKPRSVPVPKQLSYPDFQKPPKITFGGPEAPRVDPSPRPAAQIPARVRTAPAPKALIADSSELMKNPKKARIFVGYFGGIRNKIYDVVRKRYSRENAGEGTVTLYFVLRSDGRLDRAAVLDGKSECPASIKEFAVQCLREAGPFEAFPSGLEADRISFNLTVLFQEL